MIGESYGHYKILSRLGAGGMGEVYLAEDERLGRKVALKFLAPDMARSDEAVERFRNEARVAAGLSHANIAAIHGFDQHEDRWFHVHEFVEGETLEQRLAAGPLSVEEARHYLIDLARGLGHAHERGVIHRDIKPANVMITPEGSAKILDFGLARRSGTEGQTLPGVAVGTVAYMSPEQIHGETADARSDLWALGVLSYQSLSGSTPFTAPEMAAQMHKILNEEPRPLSELRPEVPADLVGCVERCLRKSRDERFARADDLLASLGLSSDSRMSHSTHAAPTAQKSNKRTGIFVAAGIIGILAAVGGIWLGTRDKGPDTGGTATGDNGNTAVSETVLVEDEFGEVTEQVIVDAQYRQRVTLYFTDVETGLPEDAWLSEGIPALINIDLTQDPFVNTAGPMEFMARVRREGSDDGQGLSPALKRKIARERMSPWFVTSRVDRNEAGEYRLQMILHETESGRATNTRTIESADIFELADATSVAIRKDLQVPEVLANEYPDLPVKELATDSETAFRDFVMGAKSIAFDNDYATARMYLDAAVAADSTFALAHFLNWAATNATQDAAGTARSGELMMRYAYRLPEAAQYMVKANYYINIQQDPEKAFAVTKMWVQLHPDDENAYRQLAAFHALRNERVEQIAALEEILRIDPSNLNVVHQVAQIYQDLGRFEESSEWMLKYVETMPDRADGYVELGELYFAMGQRDRAMENFERAVLIDGRLAEAILNIGLVHMREGRYEEAELRFEEAQRVANVANDRASVHQIRRNLYERLGRIQDALRQEEANLSALSEIVPPSQIAITRLSGIDLYLMQGQAEKALEIAQEAASELTEQIAPARALGTVDIYVAMERPQDARNDLAALEEFVDTYRVERIRPVLDTLKADILNLEGDHEAAAGLLERAAADQPSNPTLKRKLGSSLRRAGRLDEAKQQLDASLMLDPTDPLTQLEYARLYQDEGQTEAARERLELTLETWQNADPDFVQKTEALELQASLQN